MPPPPSVLWELRARTGTPMTCFLHARIGDYHRLTVRMGEKVIFTDDYKREADAIAQADFLFRDFVKDGWTEQYRRDPR